MTVRRLSVGVESKPENCELVVFKLDEQVPDNTRTVGTIHIWWDAWKSAKYYYDTGLDLAKKEACEMGADGLIITEAPVPSFWASIYVFEANAVKFGTW
jgi:hypothetical protein